MTTKMNPEIKAEWVGALRSGEYEQGMRVLSEQGKYCCLGVLCEIAVKHGMIDKKNNRDMPELVQYAGGETHVLPVEVMEWAGLNEVVPHVPNEYADDLNINVETYGDVIGLAVLNDSGKFSFERIADIIEKNL